LAAAAKKDVDGRVKPGHDGKRLIFKLLAKPENAGCFFGQALSSPTTGGEAGRLEA